MRSRSPADRSPLPPYAAEAATAAAMREGFDKAQADARQALALAPDLAQAHLALAFVSEQELSTSRRRVKRTSGPSRSRRAMRRFCDVSGEFAAYMGHFDAGVAAARRAVVLDPLARASHAVLGRALYAARRYEEAVAAFAEVISLDPEFKATYGVSRARLLRARGSCRARAPHARRKPDYWGSQ